MKRKLFLFLTLFFVGIGIVTAQTQVRGTVVDEDGEPAIGATIQVKGTAQGTVTDTNGEFTISAPANGTLVVSYVGYMTQEVPVSSNVRIALSTDTELLDEVIVTGYSQSTRRSFTGTAAVVAGDELTKKNISNVSQALAGEVPGVNVVNTSGQPGSSADIYIRGVGSVNASRGPLYVVDGVPYEGSLSAINPSDIESTTLLKDAAATSIYGARGANGVVVITTKKGRSDRTVVEADVRYGVNMSFLPRYDRITSPEDYIGLAWEAKYNRGLYARNAQGNPITDDPVAYANTTLFGGAGIHAKYNPWNVTDISQLIDPATRQVKPGVAYKYQPENWEDYAFNNSNRFESNVKISGGTNKANYYTSLGYLNDVGYIINSGFDRFTGRVNVNTNPYKWLQTHLNLSYTRSQTKNNGQTSDSGSIFWFVDNIPPIYPLFLRDENGNKMEDPYYGGYIYDYGTGRGFGSQTNSVGDATNSVEQNQSNQMTYNTGINFRFMENLVLENTFSGTFNRYARDSQNSPFYGPSASSGGSIYKVQTSTESWNLLNMLRYTKHWNDHNLELLGAHEVNSYKYNYLSVYKTRLVDPFGLELNNAVVQSPASSYQVDGTLESYFAQANYDYLSKYFISGTIRRDGSSRFKNNKWGTFGSVGFAWLLSDEAFMDKYDWIDLLKLKASYGSLGNQSGIGYYPGYDLYSITPLDGQPTLTFDTKGNPDLTWEKSQMFQVGVEFSFNKFIEGSFEYFLKNTSDLIFDRRVAPSNGYAIIKVNDGQLRNQGFEFDITAHLLRTKDYYLDFKVNGSIIKNKMIRMPIEPSTQEPKFLDLATPYGRAEGHSLYDFYIRDFLGVDPETGVSTWKMFYIDENNDGKYVASEDTRIASLTQFIQENPTLEGSIKETTTNSWSNATQHFVGKTAMPDLRGAMVLSAGFKNFELSAQFLYGLGGYALDYAYMSLMANGPIGNNNWHKDMFNRWQKPGDITDVPRLSDELDVNVSSTSTRFLTSNSFLNLNNIRLGYNLPKAFLSNYNIGGINLWISGDNLFLLSKRAGFNPSTALTGSSDTYRYSPLSTMTAGIRLNF